LASCITHHYVTNSNTYYITAIILLSPNCFAVSGKLKIWECYCSSNYHYYFPILWALALRRVAVKEVEILRQERKYRGPIMMMVLFRIGLATFYIGFLLNIFFLLVAFFALILAVSVYIFSQRNYTVNTLELKIIFFISTIGKF
jgi:hypothetical protein